MSYLSIFLMLIPILSHYGSPPAYGKISEVQPKSGPIMRDLNLKAETVVSGIGFPTSMAFLGDNDILVLEKNEGAVRRIVNGVMLEDPLLKVNVSSAGERGMLGIAVLKENNTLSKPTYVFLYYTEMVQKENLDKQNLGEPIIRNRLYRYELTDGRLTDPKLLLDLPSGPRTIHNGGAISIGMDNNIYLIVGDMYRGDPQDSELLIGTAGILRIDQEGNPVKDEEGQYVLGNTHPLNKYFAHGVRNGFGIDFDPVNGNLWDTENGPGYGDEINLVEQGFNSGWGDIQGFWTGQAPHPEDILLSPNPEALLTFGGKSEYNHPEFAVHPSIGFTALTFLNTVNYGRDYENNIVVGDFHQGSLYLLTLNENRTDLQLNGQLSDKMANNVNELKDIILGQGFGGITDIEIGPDGNIYVLSLYQGGGNCELDKPGATDCIEYDSSIAGTIFRIIPADNLLVP